MLSSYYGAMPRSRSQLRILGQALWLGMRSFGGPVRHLRIFDKKFVQESSQLSQSEFSGLVSLASLLPGPTSSQVGMAIGSELGGLLGACAFWLGFTLPSFLIMYALSLAPVSRITSYSWLLWAIKVGILLIVLKALGGLAKRFAAQLSQQVISVGAFIYFLFVSNPYLQLAGLVVAAIVGSLFIESKVQTFNLAKKGIGRKSALTLFVLAIALIAISPLLVSHSHWHMQTLGTFLQVGSLAFGGGHVILPLLQSRLISTHLTTSGIFASGYLVAQILPGPLFALAAFIGAKSGQAPHGFLGAVEATFGIFLPGGLLMLSGTYFWKKWSRSTKFLSAVSGVNAAVLGLLAVACIDIIRLH